MLLLSVLVIIMSAKRSIHAVRQFMATPIHDRRSIHS